MVQAWRGRAGGVGRREMWGFGGCGVEIIRKRNRKGVFLRIKSREKRADGISVTVRKVQRDPGSFSFIRQTAGHGDGVDHGRVFFLDVSPKRSLTTTPASRGSLSQRIKSQPLGGRTEHLRERVHR